MNQLYSTLFLTLFLFSLIVFDTKNTSMENHMASPAQIDVCNLAHLYNESYQYTLPQKVLEGFLSGKAFDHPDLYTADEKEKLQNDINEIYKRILAEDPVREKLVIITAGAPGAGKTVKLRQDRAEKVSKGTNYAYICPDDICLKSQTRTYVADIATGGDTMSVRKDAYTKWRPGSNAATHLILGNLIREKCAFYFGTTSSGPATGKFFEFLKLQGYKIRLIHVSAPDDVRWGSIQKRDKTFVQTTEQDIKEKGLLLPQRINDAFLKYADEIEFYYRPEVEQDAVLAARWLRNEDASSVTGTLQILSPESYEKIKSIHNEAIGVLKQSNLIPEDSKLLWEETVEAQSKTCNL